MGDDDRTSAAIYAGMKAYSKEHQRIRANGPDRISARAFLVAVHAFNEEMADDEDVDLVEDDEA